ncbi:MAG: hypothetical protein ACRC6I_00755, partial [Paracoccaceae bacterium]
MQILAPKVQVALAAVTQGVPAPTQGDAAVFAAMFLADAVLPEVLMDPTAARDVSEEDAVPSLVSVQAEPDETAPNPSDIPALVLTSVPPPAMPLMALPLITVNDCGSATPIAMNLPKGTSSIGAQSPAAVVLADAPAVMTGLLPSLGPTDPVVSDGQRLFTDLLLGAPAPIASGWSVPPAASVPAPVDAIMPPDPPVSLPEKGMPEPAMKLAARSDDLPVMNGPGLQTSLAAMSVNAAAAATQLRIPGLQSPAEMVLRAQVGSAEPMVVRRANALPPIPQQGTIVVTAAFQAVLSEPGEVVEGELATPDLGPEDTPISRSANLGREIKPALVLSAEPALQTEPDGVVTDMQAGLGHEGNLAHPMQTGPISRADTPPAAAAAPMPVGMVPRTVIAAARAGVAEPVSVWLDPVELGSLSFSIDMQATGLVVTIAAERP